MSAEIIVSAEQPFEVEFKVFEEDTWLVMSASNHIRVIREPLEELQTKVQEQSPLPLGGLEVRGNGAFAIVHDFDLAKPFSDEAARQSLKLLADHIESRSLTCVALQALGAFHGAEPLEDSVRRIHETNWPDCLQKLWVMSG